MALESAVNIVFAPELRLILILKYQTDEKEQTLDKNKTVTIKFNSKKI